MAGLRIVTGKDAVTCNGNEVLVSLVCTAGVAVGGHCSIAGGATGICMTKQ